MKSFDYVIKDEVGIHARPGGILVQAAKGFASDIKILKKPDREADLKRLFSVMKLGVKCGDTVTITAAGADEDAAAAALEAVMKANL
jgi:phosphocarrier protein